MTNAALCTWDKASLSAAVIILLQRKPSPTATHRQPSGSHACPESQPSSPRRVCPATVAGLFVLADASAHMKLQQAVTVSRIDLKPAAEILRAKPRPLDKQRLAATIAIIGSEEVE